MFGYLNWLSIYIDSQHLWLPLRRWCLASSTWGFPVCCHLSTWAGALCHHIIDLISGSVVQFRSQVTSRSLAQLSEIHVVSSSHCPIRRYPSICGCLWEDGVWHHQLGAWQVVVVHQHELGFFAMVSLTLSLVWLFSLGELMDILNLPHMNP